MITSIFGYKGHVAIQGPKELEPTDGGFLTPIGSVRINQEAFDRLRTLERSTEPIDTIMAFTTGEMAFFGWRGHRNTFLPKPGTPGTMDPKAHALYEPELLRPCIQEFTLESFVEFVDSGDADQPPLQVRVISLGKLVQMLAGGLGDPAALAKAFMEHGEEEAPSIEEGQDLDGKILNLMQQDRKPT